jgi:hypothetical protein
MAKGGGGEGHYDERQRAKGKADSPEVLAAISKPKKAVTKKSPVVVVKKKKVVTPREKPARTSSIPIPRAAPIRPQNTGFVSPSVSTLKPQNYGFSGGPGPDLSPQNIGFSGGLGPDLSPQNYGFSGPGPSFGGPTPNDTPDLTQQDSNFMRPDLRPQNTGFVTPTAQTRARAKAGGGRRLEDMIDAYLKRARPGGGYP